MERRRKRKSIYSAEKSRKPIRHPSLLCFAALLALGLVMASVFALPGETFTVDGLTYEVLTETGEGGTVALIRYEGNERIVTVPEVVEKPATDDDGGATPLEYTVTVIGNRSDEDGSPVGAFEGASLVSITLPASILKIEEEAFRDMTILSSLTGLAENPSVEIAEGAFHGCCFLPETDLPDGNANPFGDDVISDFKLELRGIAACTWHTGNYNTTSAPERLFKGMSESLYVYVQVADGYVLESLQRIPSEYGTDLLPYANYDIEFKAESAIDSFGTGYYLLPACKTEADSEAWEETPVVAIIAAESRAGTVPTIITDPQLSASPDTAFSVQLEAANLDDESQWSFISSGVPTWLHLDPTSGLLSGNPEAGTHDFTIRVSNSHSFHNKVFTLTVSGDATDQPDTPTPALPAPKDCQWEILPYTNTIIKATWKSVENAEEYIVQLYKDGQAIGTPVKVEDRLDPSYDFTDSIKASGQGNYFFTVIASNQSAYTDSNPATSNVYTYTVGTPVKQYTITASAGAGGSITPSGEVRVEEGGSQSFTVTTHKYYQLVSLIVDGEDLGRKTSYTFSDVAADHEIQAVFRAVSNRVGNMSASYPAGKDITFTAYGDGMDNNSPVAGDIRWFPLSWNLDGENTVYFGEGEITGTISASDLTVGTHTIQMTFVMQEFNGMEWVDVEGVDPDTREMTFEVEETDTENDATDSEKDDSTDSTDSTEEENNNSAEDSDGDSSTATKITDAVTSYFTNPQTGEILPVRVVLAATLLVLTGSVTILLSRKKTRKISASRRR